MTTSVLSETPAPAAQVHSLVAGCCIAGGGPAGLLLGLLLARNGIDVVVLEKHADFLRDFRGDTVHPSTLEVMHEIGLLEPLLLRPHQQVRELVGYVGDTRVRMADFSQLPTRCRFIAMMPQWDFLDFLAEQALAFPNFRLIRHARVERLIERNGEITGVVAASEHGPLQVHAELVVGADGRHSVVRSEAGLEVQDLGAPMDVLWLRVSRRERDPHDVLGRLQAGRMLVMIDRGDYWQCALVVEKGSYALVRQRGLGALRDSVRQLAPWLGSRVEEIAGWDDVKLLTVTVDRLRRWWRPGLICIGDAAHAMSPIGGVGINLAVQDAVAAANLLTGPLRAHRVDEQALQRVQRRRQWPTRATQWLQLKVQERVIGPVLGARGPLALPAPLQLFNRFPLLPRMMARMVGLGVRPEHIRVV